MTTNLFIDIVRTFVVKLRGERAAGQVSVVRRGSREIGFATAQRIVSDGNRVAAPARRQAGRDAAVRALGGPEVAISLPGRGDDLDHQRAALAHRCHNMYSDDALGATACCPRQRPCAPEDVAAPAEFLASNDATWITGVTQSVHGRFRLLASL